jgi:spore coat polysaccharide biosynthesis predicted glycosyltransferase SpsG
VDTDTRRGRPPLRALFRVAAGPRRGFGHFVRAVRLARALDLTARVSVRGAAEVAAAGLALGAIVERDRFRHSLSRERVDLAIIDDPNTNAARAAIAAARGAGAFTVSIHDLGLGCFDADLIVDGSAGGPYPSHRAGRALVGPRYAIVDPAVRASSARPNGGHARPDVRGGSGHPVRPGAGSRAGGVKRPRVLVALGGGRRSALALRLARAIACASPGVEVRVAGGFTPDAPARTTDGAGRTAAARRPVMPARACGSTSRLTGTPGLTSVVRWLGPRPGLTGELSRAEVAVLGGGVTLYEAAALGVPSVGVAVVESQRPTVDAMAAAGATTDGGRLFGRWASQSGIAGIASQVKTLLRHPRQRARVAVRGPQIVDGQGAARVAAAIRARLMTTARGRAAPRSRRVA